jgi:CMP-N-acetylneuraminic acid synthetase
MKDLAIIVVARKGSSRVKNKCHAEVNGWSISYTKLEQVKLAVKSLNIPTENVVISTDDEKVKEAALNHKFQVHDREEYFAVGHQASFSELIVHVTKAVEGLTNCKHILWTSPVTPLFNEQQFINCILHYKEKVIKGKHDSLVSVNLLKEYFWHKGKPLNYQANKNHTISQELEPVAKVTNACYMAPTELVYEKEYFLGENPYLYDTPQILSIDIDTVEDLEIANSIAKNLNKKDQN